MPRTKPKARPAKRAAPAKAAQSSQSQPHRDPRFAPYEAKDVRTIAGQRAYNGGRRLLREGHLSQGRLRGQSLLGTFPSVTWWGTDSIQATVMLPPAGRSFEATSLSSSCTCLEERPCQHVVALLLAWIERNDTITEVPSIAETLAGRSTDELLAIITKMIDVHPELESVIALPPPVPGRAPNKTTLNPSLIKSSVASALRQMSQPIRSPYAWNAISAVNSEEMDRLLNLSLDYGHANLWADSVLILCEIAEQVVAASRDDEVIGLHDDLVIECDSGLATCLTRQAELPTVDRLDSNQRMRMIRALLELWRLDLLDPPPTGISRFGPSALALHATTSEKVEIDQWLHTMEIDGTFDVGMVSEFLTLLFSHGEHDTGEMLARYREIELWDRVALTELDLGMVDEAIGTAKRHLRTIDGMTVFAAALAIAGNHQHLDQAISLIEDFAWEIEGRNADDDSLVGSWLAFHYTKAGRGPEALRLADEWFRQDPALEPWRCVKEAASLPGQPADAWSSREGAMEATLKQQHLWYDLTLIYADELRIEDALAAMTQVQEHLITDSPLDTEDVLNDLQIAIAEARERADPDGTIAIYMQSANQFLAMRTRENYQLAVRYLARIRYVLEQVGRSDEWTAMVQDIRQKNRTLRAFLEELNAADL